MSKNWYILYVNVGQEIKIVNSLKKELMLSEYKDYVGDIKAPTESIVQLRKGKKKQVEKTFLSGYILIELELTDDKKQWVSLCSFINRMNGVKKFVGFEKNQRPVPVGTEEVQYIFERMGAIKPLDSTLKMIYAEGDKVKIIDGPFTEFSGTIEEINYEKSKLKVSVQIFGRSTPVDLNFNQIESGF